MSNVPEMTLRDWFAGQALNAILSNASIYREVDEVRSWQIEIETKLSEMAYKYADAMMAEREKTLNIQNDSTLLKE